MLLPLALSACVSAEPVSDTQQPLGIGGCGSLCADDVALPSEHAAAYWSVVPTTFPYAPADDHTLALGWNADNAVPNEPRWYALFESNYQPTPTAPALMEWHIQGWWPDSTIRRPLTMTADRDTKILDVGIRGQFTVWDSTASYLRFKITDGALPSWQMFNMGLDWQVNNQRMLSGLNAGSTGYIEVARISTADEVLLAAGGHPTRTAGPLEVRPAGLSRLEVSAIGIGMHGQPPQPQCNISDSDVATMVGELLQCLHDRGDANWAGAQ